MLLSERRGMAARKNKLNFDGIYNIISARGGRVHFIGVGGVSMYSLARLAMRLGASVSGSDRVVSKRTKELSLRGAKIFIGHDGANINGASLVVYTHAISKDNPELIAAKNSGIAMVSRAELLGALMLSYNTRIGVSGTHGKSTTTSMLDAIFCAALSQPTTLSGAELQNGEPIRVGRNNHLIYEACEYRDSFLSFSPSVAIALNMELDHTDYFPDIEAMKASYIKALNKASDFALVNYDDENLLSILPKLKCKTITFGQGERSDWRYLITGFLESGMEISLYRFGSLECKIRLNIHGVHNAENAAAAAIASIEFGIPKETVALALGGFIGVPRRLELVGYRHDRAVYYDYAHHPTEIECGINTLRLISGGEITVVFKPHTYTRTASLWADFSAALSLADHVILTDIYPAREEPIAGVSSERLAADIGERAIYSRDADVSEIVDLQTSGIIVVMGAGDTEKIKNQLISK